MPDSDELFEQATKLSGKALHQFLTKLPERQRTRVQQLLNAEASLNRRGSEFLKPPSNPSAEPEPTFLSDNDVDGPDAAEKDTGEITSRDFDATFISGTDQADRNMRDEASEKEPVVGDNVRYFGEYELLDEIARGGMGVVFKARQVSLNRIVALKMILSGNLAGDEEISRFQTEAEAAAKLDHWGIVPIFEIGEHEGQHYFSMGLVEGDSLADRIRKGPLEPKAAAEQCRKITEAIAYAHENGVIHRDLKPANVLLDRDDQPKITDFGLAKQVQGDSNLTRTGAVMGTPGYMPPEQAQGDSDNIGPAADVYSIGAILYATLTGHPPFQAANVMDTLRQVMEQEPVPPRQLNPSIDKDLQTICLKCLEKSPARRYGSANELVEELQRYENGEPIHARPIGMIERALRWRRRYPARAALVTIVAGLFMTAPLIAARQAQVAQRQRELKEDAVVARDEAETRRKEAEDSKAKAETARIEAEVARTEAEAARAAVEREQANTSGLLYSAQVALAHREWLDNNPERVRQLLMASPEDQRGWEWEYLDGLTRAEARLFSAHQVPQSVEFSPNGKLLLTRGASDSQVKLWDIASGLEIRTKTVERLAAADYLDEDRLLVSAGTNAVIVNIDSGAAQGFGDFGQRITDARPFDNNTKLATAFGDGTIVIYDIASGEETFRSPKRIVSNRGHEFSPDGKLVATVIGTAIHVHDVATTDIAFKVTGHAMKLNDAKFSPDSRWLAVADGTGNVSLTDVETGEKRHTFRAHSSGATVVEFSRDSKRVATGSQDHTVRVYDVDTGDPLLVVRGHWQYITDIDFSPDGKRLATGSGDGSARVWNIADRIAKADHVAEVLAEERAVHLGHEAGMEAQILYGHKGPVYDVAISPDGNFVATSAMGTGHGDQQICVWSKPDAAVVAGFPVKAGYLHTFSFSADSRHLLVASGGAGDAVSPGSVAVWDLQSKRKIHDIDGVPCMLTAAALNPQNDLLAVVFGNQNFGRLRLYSFPDCELLNDEEITGERFSCVAFSASGEEVITSTQPGGSINVWNAQTCERIHNWKAHGTGVFRIAVSSDDKLATANIDGTIGIWNWKTQQQLGELKGHGLYCVDVDFSPDGSRLVSSSEDDTVKVWNLDTMRELLTFRDHRLSALGCDWSDDGRTIASVSRDGSLILRELHRDDAQKAEEEWLTLFEDDFERDKLGDDWNSQALAENIGLENSAAEDALQWRIENGRLTGVLQPTPANGGTFPAAFVGLRDVVLPRTVDVSVDVILKQPLVAQVALSNSRTKQSIAPFVSTIDRPFGFQGSSVLTMRGSAGAKLLGAKQTVEIQPDKPYRFRLLRDREELKFFVDGRLLEHVNVTAIEADVLTLSGSWSANGDEISFDNVVVKVPESAMRELQIRKQVNDWLTEMMVPELVEEAITAEYNEDDLDLAEALLAGLTSSAPPSKALILENFTQTAIRTDASEREYRIAARQADMFLKLYPDEWWLWSKVALAWMRAGRMNDALERLDLAVARCMKEDGHVLPLVRVGRALTFHAMDKQQDAQREHRWLLDLCQTPWKSIGLNEYKAELADKVPVETNPLRQQLIDQQMAADKGYWYGRNMQKMFANKWDDFTMVQGRNEEPDDYDRTYARAEAMKLSAIYSAFQPPPKLHRIYDDIEFQHEDGSDKATLQWLSIQKFDEMKFRFGQTFEFENRDGEWKVVHERTWHEDLRINDEIRRFDDEHWAKLDEQLEETPADDPERPALLLQAMRFEEAYGAAKVGAGGPTAQRDSGSAVLAVVSTLTGSVRRPEPTDDARGLVILGEAAIATKRFDEGIETLEEARRTDPTTRMPWFLTRQDRVFSGMPSIVFSLAFHPTEQTMVTGHQNKSIVFWKPRWNEIKHKISDAHAAHVVGVAVSHDGKRIISIGWDNILNVHDIKTGKRVQQLSGHLERLYRLKQHPSKNIVVTSSADNTARIWDLDRERELFTLTGHTNDVMCAAFRPDGDQIATASADGSIRLWDVSTGQETAKMEAHEAGAWRVDYTPDGKRLLSCGRGGKVKMWDAKTYELIHEFAAHDSHVEVVGVSPDGRLAASGDVDGLICIYDLEEQKLIATLPGHRNAIYDLAFYDDHLYTVSADRTIRRWDIDFETSPLTRALERLP